MQREDLMTQDVVPGSEVRGDRDGRGEIIRHQRIRGPLSRSRGAVDEARGVDFEPGEVLLGDGGEFARNGGEVGYDWPVVALRPGVLHSVNISH